jgi:hypothetical protein
MRATELAILYLLIGSGSAIFLMVKKQRVLDAALLVPFWPLYGPFLLLGQTPAEGDVVARLRSRIAEIDRSLARPELDERTARLRLEELRERGDVRAADSVQARLTSIDRLRRLRERFARELTEIDELCAQLRVQSEILRIAGSSNGDPKDLVEEIAARVDALEATLAMDLDSPTTDAGLR